jgi:hypothetical protein
MPSPDEFDWVNFLTRHEQSQLQRRMEAINKAAEQAAQKAMLEAMKKGTCKKCGTVPSDCQAKACRTCGAATKTHTLFENMFKTIDKKRQYDLKALFKAYQVRVPVEYGGARYLGGQIKNVLSAPKRATVDKVKSKYQAWAERHSKTADTLAKTYGVGCKVYEGYSHVSTVRAGISVVQTGGAFVANGLASQLLGPWVVAAASGPAGVVFVAWGVYDFVNKMGGRLWTLIDSHKRWDAETGSLQTRLARVLKQLFTVSIWKSYYKGRSGLDVIANWEGMLIQEYSALRESYVEWDKHRRELITQANELGLEFGKLQRLVKEATRFAANRLENNRYNDQSRHTSATQLRSSDRKKAETLIKDVGKESDKLYKEIEKIIKDLNTRGSKTLNDLNTKLALLHNSKQEISTLKPRWFKDETGDWQRRQGVKIANSNQIDSMLAIPSNERWVGGQMPQGQIDKLDAIEKHGFQRGFLEWISMKHKLV